MNALARYYARGGCRFVTVARPCPGANTFTALAYQRARYIKQRRAGHELKFTEYGWLLRIAMSPTLHTLAQRELDIRIVGIYRDMLAAQARAVA